MPKNFVYVRILQMQGDARSDANEANDMQKLVFAYLSRRASHLCKPGMTAGGAGRTKRGGGGAVDKKARSMNGLVGNV